MLPAWEEKEIVQIEVPTGSSVNMRDANNLNSSVFFSLEFSTEVVLISEENEKSEFKNIVIKLGERGGDTIEGWVHESFVTTHSTEEANTEDYAEIVDNLVEVEVLATPTGWLRVRKVPRGEEIGKLNVGEIVQYSNETTTWYEVVLHDGTKGWISKQYAALLLNK